VTTKSNRGNLKLARKNLLTQLLKREVVKTKTNETKSRKAVEAWMKEIPSSLAGLEGANMRGKVQSHGRPNFLRRLSHERKTITDLYHILYQSALKPPKFFSKNSRALQDARQRQNPGKIWARWRFLLRFCDYKDSGVFLFLFRNGYSPGSRWRKVV